jgi:hypothetical protein
MHGRTYGHLDGFQVEAACLATIVEDDAQELVYFARDFLADLLGRFFSWSLGGASSTGRRRQIFSLISTKVRFNS